MKKRFLAITLALMMCLTLMPRTALAADKVDFNGHSYQRIDSGMTWKEAVKYCENLGGHLATITSAEEQELVKNLVSGGTKAQYWLGGTDEAEEGNWAWITGESWTFWADTITFNNYQGTEHYLQMNRHNWGDESKLGVWNDINNENYIEGEEEFFSTDLIGLICEWDESTPDTSKELIASTWAKAELVEAEKRGLIPEALYSKDLRQPINRAEFAAVSVKAYEALTKTTARAGVNPFTDTYDQEVLKAYTLGITNGTSTTKFSPFVTLNREQAATMLTRVLKKAANQSWTLDTDKDYSLVYTRGSLFSDNAQISDFAWDSVYFMAAKGIIDGTGNNKFSPRATTDAETALGYASATREQALLIALRMVKFSDGTEIKGIISQASSASAITVSGGIDSFMPKGFDWKGGANGDDIFIDGKWVSPDGKSVLYISHDEGPDSFTIWYYSCKGGYLENDVYQMRHADIIGEGKAECVYAGLTFTGVRDGLLVESEWLDEMYEQYGSPDGIYYLEKAR